MKYIRLDGKRMESKKDLYRQLQRAFAFPPYFGNNLDALWDVLNETNEPTTIEFLNAQVVVAELGNYGEKLIELFKMLDENNEYYNVYFDLDEMNKD